MPQNIDLGNSDLKVCWINCLGKPLALRGRGKYKIFKAVEGRYGIYIFIDDQDNFLYVGKAHKRPLKDRITQYYREPDTGGTFRKKWCEKNGDFTQFKEALKNWKILTISTSKKSDAWINPIESLAIYILNPRYNDEYDESSPSWNQSQIRILKQHQCIRKMTKLYPYICKLIRKL